MKGTVRSDGSADGRVLFDTCPMEFETVAAPY
jgi:hypothetical protein